jgi:hypothetical protein
MGLNWVLDDCFVVRILSANCFLPGPTRPKSENRKPAILLDRVGPYRALSHPLAEWHQGDRIWPRAVTDAEVRRSPTGKIQHELLLVGRRLRTGVVSPSLEDDDRRSPATGIFAGQPE